MLFAGEQPAIYRWSSMGHVFTDGRPYGHLHRPPERIQDLEVALVAQERLEAALAWPRSRYLLL